MREESVCAKGAEGERGHHAELADGEKSDEAERIHSREIGFAIRDVHRTPESASAEGGENAVHWICTSGVRTRRSDRKDCCADAHDESATQNAEPATEASAAEFVEKKKSPEDAKERIRIPEREGDAEANIANGINGEGVGNGPETACQDCPNDEMGTAARICSNGTRAENERRKTPASEKNSDDHEERDDHRRKAKCDEFCGGFGCAEPGASGEAREDAEKLKSSRARGKICFGGDGGSGHC